ncbi:MAG: phage tail sheath family protein [Blastocatellia bacterium]|nr:phage tail sheath family protein [Blastocatellia bacterium]
MPVEADYPGVFLEEVAGGVSTISRVDTSVTAFAGWAPMGPTDRAEPVASWGEFEIKFGGLDVRGLLGYSVYHFFGNGGRKAYVLRLTATDSDSADGIVLEPNVSDFENTLLPADGSGGLYDLDRIDIFNLLCVPGETNPVTVMALQKFCRDRRAFLILDCPEGAAFDDVRSIPGLISGDDSINAAFYFPWIVAPDKLQEDSPREFPPCGFVAGLYARTDSSHGVWKAPAGTDARLTGVVGVASDKNLTDTQNGVLNRKAVNCIRSLPDRGTVVWGGRTLRGADELGSEWKYVSVRRTGLFIEESLYRGLKWVVFEPDDEPLWAQIRLTVGNFMYDMFRRGALQGSTTKNAYFVKCDQTTTTQNDIDRGFVNIVVGFAPIKPAEFVIIRLQQLTAGILV